MNAPSHHRDVGLRRNTPAHRRGHGSRRVDGHGPGRAVWRGSIVVVAIALVAGCSSDPGAATPSGSPDPASGPEAASTPAAPSSGAPPSPTTTATPDSTATPGSTATSSTAPSISDETTSLPGDVAQQVLEQREAGWPDRVAIETFDIDTAAPLDVVEVARDDHDGIAIREVTFASPDGGVVPALIAEPADPVGRAMVMVPGMPERKEAYVPAISEFACTGLTAIVVDPPWTRDPDRSFEESISFTPLDRGEQVQLIHDVRRAVDLLEAEYGVDRVGYTAISYGASMGLQVAAVEPRIDALALLSVDGGVVDHFTSEGNPIGILAMGTPEDQQAWIDAMAPVEPVRFVAEATAPILFLHGRQDNVAPPVKARVVHGVAGESADVRWYDAGHGLEPQAFRDMFDWWAAQFDLDVDRVAACPAGE